MNDTVATTAETAAPVPPTPPADFSDRLSPMLVKELRQGLRARSFTSAFILLQVLLMFSTFVASSVPKSNEMLGGFFWFFLSVALFLVQPLRGVNALHVESKLNTLELILLTRLEAFRIVTGKWASIVSQSLLITVAVLPYVVLRYFLGGVDLIQDLIYLFVLLFFSAVLTALTVGFSAFRAVLLRGVLFATAGFGAVSSVNVIMAFMRFNSSMSFATSFTPGTYALTIIGILFTGAFYIYYLLDLGATRIAPPSSNHATRKRLLSLAAISIIFSLTAVGVQPEFSLWVAFSIMVVASIDALTENPAVTAGVFQGKLYRRILPGPARFFLAPGWHTGIFFYLLMLVLFAAFIAYQFLSTYDPEYLGISIVFSGIIIFPVLITQLFIRHSTQLMNQYVVIQCICTVIAAILGAATEAADTKMVLWLGCFIPHVAFFIIIDSSSNIPPISILTASVILVTVGVGLWRGFPLFRKMNAAYRIARSQTSAYPAESPPSPTDAPDPV